RRQYRSMDKTTSEETGSGVGVLDKAAIVLGALEAGPATLAQLVQSTGLARPTAHRLAVALEYHHLVSGICRDASSWARGWGNWPLRPGRIACWPRPARSWQPCGTTPASLPSCTAVRAITGSAWPRRSGPSACGTPCRWARP